MPLAIDSFPQAGSDSVLALLDRLATYPILDVVDRGKGLGGVIIYRARVGMMTVGTVIIEGGVVVPGMPVHKEVTVTATSPESWEAAALNAVDRTDATVSNLQWAVVQDQSIQLKSSESPEFRTKVKIGFEVEE